MFWNIVKYHNTKSVWENHYCFNSLLLINTNLTNVPLLHDNVRLLRKDATLFDPQSHVLIQTRHDLATPLSLHNVPPDMRQADLSYPENKKKPL